MTPSTAILSVIMPVFNGERYLTEAIESVLGQTRRDFEFIIIDDGSTDGSPALLESFRKRDERIRLYTQSNQGIGATKKAGVERAAGKYIAFIDQDDLAYPKRFETQIEFLDRNPRVACVGSFYDFIDERNRVLDVGRPPVDHRGLYVENMLEGHNLLCNSMVMAETRAIVDAGNLDQRYAPADDFDLYLRLGRNRDIMNIPLVLGAYRVHASNHSVVNATRMEFRRWEACIRERQSQGLTSVPRGFPVPIMRPLHWRFPAPMALNGGRWGIALEYSLKQLRYAPFKTGSWRLLSLALLGNLLSLFRWVGASPQSIQGLHSAIRRTIRHTRVGA